MRRFPNSQAAAGRRRHDAGSRGASRKALTLALLCLVVGFTASAAAQQDGRPAGAGQTETGDAVVTLREALGQIDGLIAQLDVRIKDTWARSEEVLELADATTDPDEQMRLEELYGKTAALAQGLEEQRSKLRALRDEIAATGDMLAP